MARPVATGAIVVTWQGGAATRRCVDSLRAQAPAPMIVVVDNASDEAERQALRDEYGAAPDVRLVLLDENRHFAGGLNAGAAAAIAAGAERLLFLNNDTVVDPGALALLEEALDAPAADGIVGPLVVDAARPTRVISAGEVHRISLLCVPRTLLRPRRTDGEARRVSGLMGCALLVGRRCWETVGGFSEEIEVYYEDVDFCLAARAAGYATWIEPRAVVRHDGMRGFARGLTAWAGYLKARNPWFVMRRHGGPVAWITFVPTYAALIAASAAGYAARGRGEVVRALGRGVGAGVRAVLTGRSARTAAPARSG
jgi:N-acetylglucosaminyl-diphospho-decaprenol L-rhamnosyltransferase